MLSEKMKEWREIADYPAATKAGGYPMIYHTDFGNMVCACCAKKLENDACETVEDFQVYWEGSAIQCDECGEMMESAYGDPDSEDSE